MKKIVSLILVVAMVLSLSIIAFAVKKGDVNNDGAVAATDALYVLQHAAGLRTLSAAEQARGDYTGDGKVSAIDARKILQVVAGIIPAEEMTTSPGPVIGDGDSNDSVSWDDLINKK